MMLLRTYRPPLTTAAAVSSHEDSIARMSMGHAVRVGARVRRAREGVVELSNPRVRGLAEGHVVLPVHGGVGGRGGHHVGVLAVVAVVAAARALHREAVLRVEALGALIRDAHFEGDPRR